jgi:hypothetical protein
MGEGNIILDKWTGGRTRIWRVRTDQELRNVYKDLDVIADIKRRD